MITSLTDCRVCCLLRKAFRGTLALVAGVAASTLLWAEPALAAVPGWRGSGLPLLQVLGIFVALPLGLFVIIVLLFVLFPSWVSESRGSGGLTWTAEPVWFGGPRDSRQSVEVAKPSQDGGGASASW